MSEKIYAYLLRLFPSAFCRHYQDEALQLYRDRLRDESGFLRRLRLTLDLITDIARALPLAYDNSYSAVATAAQLTPKLDRLPSFQTLQQEPLQRGAMASASVLAVTAFADRIRISWNLSAVRCLPSNPSSNISINPYRRIR
jgi:hypothetical protein